MGRWGFGSDENDWTYDLVGLGIEDRVEGIRLTKHGRSSNGFIKDLVEEEGTSILDDVGVVVFLLKLGCPIPLDKLQAARIALARENRSDQFAGHFKERRAVVKQEIRMIDAAIANGGQVPGPPSGVHCISDQFVQSR